MISLPTETKILQSVNEEANENKWNRKYGNFENNQVVLSVKTPSERRKYEKILLNYFL